MPNEERCPTCGQTRADEYTLCESSFHHDCSKTGHEWTEHFYEEAINSGGRAIRFACLRCGRPKHG